MSDADRARDLVEAAGEAEARGDVETALDHWRRAADAFSEGDDPRAGVAMMAAGRLLLQHDRYGEARTALTDARRALPRLGAPLALAECDLHLGLAHQELGDARRARSCFERAMDRYDEAGVPEAGARAAILVASALHDRGRHEGARYALERARPILADAGDVEGLALVDLELGLVLHALDRTDSALVAMERARDALASHGDPMDVASCDLNLGNILRGLGRMEDAEARYRTARDAFQRLDRPAEIAHCDHNLALILAHRRERERALELLESAAETYRQLDTARRLADSLAAIGDVLLAAGQQPLAMRRLREAERIFELLRLPVPAANCRDTRAVALAELGELGDALELHHDAIIACREADAQGDLAIALMNRGSTLDDAGRFVDALDSYRAALALHADADRRDGVAGCILNTSWPLLHLGRASDARRAVSAARALWTGDKAAINRAYCDWSEARIRAAEGEPEAAAALARRAVGVMDMAGDDHDRGAARVMRTLARALHHAGRPREARVRLADAFARSRALGLRLEAHRCRILGADWGHSIRSA